MESYSVTFTQPGQVAMTKRSVRELMPHELLLEAEASVISAGTERHLLQKAFYYPFYPGYSFVGRVIAKGEQVRGVALGDRVAATAEHASIAIVDARMAFKVPDNVIAEHAAFHTVGATALYALRLGGIHFGDPVVVIGQGLIGQLAAQLAKLFGALPVAAIEIDPRRLALSRELGTDHVFDGNDSAVIDRFAASLPGGGFGAAIEFSGAEGAVATGVRLTRRRGHVVSAARIGPIAGDVFATAFMKGLKIVGAYFNARPWRLDATEVVPPTDWPIRPAGTTEFEGGDVATSGGDTRLFLELLAHGRVSVAPLVSRTVKPDQAPALFGELAQGDLLGGVIDWR